MSEDIGSTTTETTSATTTDTTPQTTSASETQSQGATSSTGTEGMGEASQQAIAQAYNPNFKFKYFDAKENKQIEKEFDEWIRPTIKDQKTEKELRDLYERAYGLDAAKNSREKARMEAETLRSEVKDTKKALNVLSSYVQSGDMQSFFEALKIPEDKVLKYVQERIQYREMTPEQRAHYDSFRTTQQRATFLQEQNQALEQKFVETQSAARAQDLDRHLGDPNISQVAQAFDARFGRSGAFRDEVIRRGQYYWHQFQKDIPVEQAVNEVIQIAGGMQPSQANPTAIAPQAAPSPAAAKPVIPNIQGKGTSPAKKMPRSIDDLKKLRSAMV